ncbi:MAG: hypothetical protein U1F47_02515 [Hyphomicrobiales bacterium]|jgi:hypothetical protein
MSRVKVAGYTLKLPRHPVLRMGMGGLLLCGGFLGFLPVLGFWMVPLGLVILSVDLPAVRRWTRILNVRLGLFLHRHRPGLARRMGFGAHRPSRGL